MTGHKGIDGLNDPATNKSTGFTREPPAGAPPVSVLPDSLGLVLDAR